MSDDRHITSDALGDALRSFAVPEALAAEACQLEPPMPQDRRDWLERRLDALPALRQAMRERRISYEKARLVAGYADDATIEAWFERAERTKRRTRSPGSSGSVRARRATRSREPGRRAARRVSHSREDSR